MNKAQGKAKFFRLVLGNIVIIATLALLITVTVMPPSNKADAQRSSEPYYNGKSTTKVSLMINVYWGNEYIGPMLDILDKYNVKTTFFVGGSWAVGNADTLKRIHAAGHEIGNHGYYHKDHSKLDEAYNSKEIGDTHAAVQELIGVNMTVFAPPSGAFSAATISAASALGYRTVMWTRDTVDWRDHDAELIYKRAVKNIKGGDLILMHPTDCTLKALERIIVAVFNANLRVAPVSEVLDGTVVA